MLTELTSNNFLHGTLFFLADGFRPGRDQVNGIEPVEPSSLLRRELAEGFHANTQRARGLYRRRELPVMQAALYRWGLEELVPEQCPDGAGRGRG